MEHYGAAVERVGSPSELVDVATAIFREDLDAGYVAVLVEMIAGASSTPGLGPEVSARLGPWFAFAEQAVTTTVGRSPLDSVLPPGDVAYAIVALLSRARDADPSRRRPRPGARSVRPRQDPGRPSGGADPAATDNEAAMTGTGPRRLPSRQPSRHRARCRHRRLQLLGRRPRTRAAAPPAVRCAPSPGIPDGRPPGTAIDVRPLDFDDHLGLVASLVRSDHPLQHLLGALRPPHRRPRAGGRQLEDALPRRQAGRGPADRAREHHAPEQQLAFALLPGQGPRGAGARRVRCLLRHRAPGHPLRRRRASCSTTSPGSCAGCPSSPSAAAATTGSGASMSTTWRSLCLAKAAETARQRDRRRRSGAADLHRARRRRQASGRQPCPARPRAGCHRAPCSPACSGSRCTTCSSPPTSTGPWRPAWPTPMVPPPAPRRSRSGWPSTGRPSASTTPTSYPPLRAPRDTAGAPSAGVALAALSRPSSIALGVIATSGVYGSRLAWLLGVACRSWREHAAGSPERPAATAGRSDRPTRSPSRPPFGIPRRRRLLLTTLFSCPRPQPAV